ncbi:hypothetical protein [Corynebacterium appendicis]|nr:hypothetical protein [Corynebacterium appendicis]
MKVLLPRTEQRAATPARSGSSSGESPPFNPLIRVALDAAFGIRDIQTLQKRTFAPIVRSYLRARRIGGMQKRGLVTVSASRRRGQEFFGTAESQGARYAWVARINADRLESFRVL